MVGSRLFVPSERIRFPLYEGGPSLIRNTGRPRNPFSFLSRPASIISSALISTAAFADPGQADIIIEHQFLNPLSVSTALTGVGILGRLLSRGNRGVGNFFSYGIVPMGIGGILGSLSGSLFGTGPSVYGNEPSLIPLLVGAGSALGVSGIIYGLSNSLGKTRHNGHLWVPILLSVLSSIPGAYMTANVPKYAVSLDVSQIPPDYDRPASSDITDFAQRAGGAVANGSSPSSHPSGGSLLPDKAILRTMSSTELTDESRAQSIQIASQLYFIYLDNLLQKGKVRQAYDSIESLFKSKTPSGTSFETLLGMGAKKDNNPWGASNYNSYRARIAERLSIEVNERPLSQEYLAQSTNSYLDAQNDVLRFLGIGTDMRRASLSDRMATINSIIRRSPDSDPANILRLTQAGWMGAEASLTATRYLNKDYSYQECEQAYDILSGLIDVTVIGPDGKPIKAYSLSDASHPFLRLSVQGNTANALIGMALKGGGILTRGQRVDYARQALDDYAYPTMQFVFNHFAHDSQRSLLPDGASLTLPLL